MNKNGTILCSCRAFVGQEMLISACVYIDRTKVLVDELTRLSAFLGA